MLKLLAIVRTLFLVFIVGYTWRATPAFFTVARTFDESYARCTESLSLLTKAAWLAVGWILVETALGWLLALRRPAAAPPAPSAGTR